MKVMTVINPRALPEQWDRLGDVALSQMLMMEHSKRYGESSTILITGSCESQGDNSQVLQDKCKELGALIDATYEYPEGKVFSQKKFYQHLRDRAAYHKPDVIHIQQAQVAAASHIDSLATDTGIPVIWTLHNPPEGRATFQYAESYKKILENPLCRIVCVSKSARDRLMKTLKLEVVPKNLLYIWNGVIVPDSIEVITESQKTYDIVGIGRIDPPKNTEYLLRFMANRPRLKCLYVGDTFSTYDSDHEYVERCKQILTTAKNITWIPSVSHDRVYALLRASKYYMTLSRVETFSLTSCEAMMVGTPVICINEAGPGEIVSEDAGIKIDPVLRARMEYYWHNIDILLEDDRRNGYDYVYSSLGIQEYARENFSSVSMYNKYEKLYKGLSLYD